MYRYIVWRHGQIKCCFHLSLVERWKYMRKARPVANIQQALAAQFRPNKNANLEMFLYILFTWTWLHMYTHIPRIYRLNYFYQYAYTRRALLRQSNVYFLLKIICKCYAYIRYILVACVFYTLSQIIRNVNFWVFFSFRRYTHGTNKNVFFFR